MKLTALTADLGLKILALVLAVLLYHALKTESASTGDRHDERTLRSN